MHYDWQRPDPPNPSREIAAALRLRSSGYISTLIRSGDRELAGDELLQDLARQAIAALQIA
jgi:hypothetical protein